MSLNRFARRMLALVLVISCLLFCACSAPKVAMKVGDKTYEMGDYLAYAYGTAFADQNAYFYLMYYGENALTMDFVYGEGDDEKDVKMEEYLILTTRDMMVRQKVLEDMMEEYKLEWDKDELKSVNAELAKLKNDQFIPLGFNNDRYIKMFKALQLNESTVFNGLYNKGGAREVSDTDMRKYFEENYLSYYTFELSLVDKDNKALADEIIKDYQEHFDEYLKEFNKSKKTPADFQEIYKKFKADTAETTPTDEKDTKADDKTTPTDEKAERQELVKEQDGADEELIKAIENIPEGSAEVVKYKKGGSTNTLAFIFRLDPEAERGEKENFFEDNRDQTLQYMKYDEFEKEVEKQVKKELEKADINEKALKAVDFMELLGFKS